jgi:predicted outer membrane protein
MSLHTTLMAMSLFVGGADQAPGDVSPLDDMEKSFIDTIAAADRAEMELSRAIVARSTKPSVRRLARVLLNEDAANYHELFRLCLTKTYAIAPQLDERHREALRRVQYNAPANAADGNGREIEQTYLDTIRVDKADISGVLERVSSDATDGELSRFAADTLAMVQKHQQLLHELNSNTRG